MLSAQQKKLKGILEVPDHLYGKYNLIRSKLEYADLAQSFKIDAYDFLFSLRSMPTVFKKQDGSILFSSSCYIRQSFEFKQFNLHFDHSTLVTLTIDPNKEINKSTLTILEEGLGTSFCIEQNNNEIEELNGHVGLNLYHCISLNTHCMLPSVLQLQQLKLNLILGLCEQYDCVPKVVLSKLFEEFENDVSDL
jgi:hypothetical protein